MLLLTMYIKTYILLMMIIYMMMFVDDTFFFFVYFSSLFVFVCIKRPWGKGAVKRPAQEKKTHFVDLFIYFVFFFCSFACYNILLWTKLMLQKNKWIIINLKQKTKICKASLLLQAPNFLKNDTKYYTATPHTTVDE